MLNLNGGPADIKGGLTLLDLLKLLRRDPAMTAVTVDGVFIPRSDYPRSVVPEGAKVVIRELLEGG